MSENQPYVPSPEEIKKAEDSMGVKERIMSRLRKVDVRDATAEGVSMETLSGVEWDNENESWLINRHNVKYDVYRGLISIDGKMATENISEAFWKKYGLTLAAADPDIKKTYEDLAESIIRNSPDLHTEYAIEDVEKDRRIALADLDALLS